MDRIQGIGRPIAPIDFAQHPELQALVDAWRVSEPSELDDLANGPFAPFVDDMVVLEQRGQEDFVYLHYGQGVSGGSGLDMVGKKTSEFDSGLGHYFAKIYREALRLGVPYYSVNRAKESHLTHSWQRLALPFASKAPGQPHRVAAYVRPTRLIEDVLGEFAESTGFIGGTLEPVVSDDRVVDFAILMLSGSERVLGKGTYHISELIGRALSAQEADAIVQADEGQIVFREELPHQQARPGRRFLLTITGSRPQPVFSMLDATELLDARAQSEQRRQQMADFAESASDWMWETDANHVATMLTDAVTDQLGLPPEHFLGRPGIGGAKMPENRAVLAAHRQDLENRRPFRNLVFKMMGGDGKHRWVRLNGNPRFADDGRFLGYRGTGSNITAEIDARQALEAQNTAMRDFAEMASDWKWQTDREHRFTQITDVIESHFARPQLYMGRTRFEIFDHPENVETFAELRRLLDQQKPFKNIDYASYCDEPRRTWIRISGKPFYDASGTFMGYRGTGSSVTEEIEAKKALEQRNKAMADFASTGSDWMWEADAHNNMTMITNAVERYVGHPPSYFIGKNRFDFADCAENRAVFAKHRKDIEARRSFDNLVYRIVAKDGAPHWFRVSGVPTYRDDGTFTGYRGIGTDITAEIEAKQQIEAQKTAMADFANTASDWLWEVDADHIITMMSAAIETFTGRPAAAYLGTSRYDLIAMNGETEDIQAHRKVIADRQPFTNFVYQVTLPDGRSLWARANGKPLFDADGTFVGYRGTGTNITEEFEAKQQLEAQQAAMADFAETASDWLWETDAQSTFTYVSETIRERTGFGPDDYVGRNWFEMVNASEHNDTIEHHRQLKGERRPFKDLVYRSLRADGSSMWVRASGKPRTDDEGVFVGYRGTGSDITAEVEAREQAARRAKELSEAHRLGRLGAWSFNIASQTVHLSPEYLGLVELTQVHARMSLDQALFCIAPASREAVKRAFRQVLRNRKEAHLDIEWIAGRSQALDLSVIARPRFDDQGRVLEVFGTVQDISERKQSERDLEALAFHDPLTGLGNRSYFARDLEETLQKVVRSEGAAGLMILDLDHFKEVNDSLGHAAGDELLRRVAERLSVSMSGHGNVYRLGGDEFAVIVPNIARASALGSFATSIIATLQSPMKLSYGSVSVSTSIGMVMLPSQTKDGEEAMRFADLALYEAKSSGRNRFMLFNTDLDQEVQERVNLAKDLKSALKKDDLDAHYQLQVDVREGQVCGFEGLVRWTHPLRGSIPPSKFIPIAESSRLIADLGEWMVRRVCREGKVWLDAGGAPLEMSVNLSVAQLWHRDVDRDIKKALDDTGFPAELLCVELTESVFSEDAMPRIRRLFSSLKALGVKIALDDFGTGYSSLQYLNRLSFDKLKIDRAFVANCDGDAEKLRLLQGIIGLGKGMGLGIIVEGVETEAELQLVCDLGCDAVQGFFFAKPKPFHEACLDAAQVEAEYGFNPVFWKSHEPIAPDAPFMRKIRARLANISNNKPASNRRGRA